MSSSIRRIGILSGGGDCPGINAVIRAVAKTAMLQHGLGVTGILDGFAGLVENRMRELSVADVAGILTRGGTILGTNNSCNPSRVHCGADAAGQPIFADRVQQCMDHIRKAQLDALVVIGGDGTMSCAAPFVEAGVRCVGVPKTIDNDLVGTDLTFGFLSACATATEAIDRLHTTAESHHRVMVCEVMGRNAGWLALHAGIASGSDVILIPEIPYDLARVRDFLKERRERGVKYAIVIVAEGARAVGGGQVVARTHAGRPDPVQLGGIGLRIADELSELCKVETRATVLGHVVRGGSPIPADRVLASRLGYQAMELLISGASGRMVVIRDGKIGDASMLEAAHRQRLVPADSPLIAMARAVRTCFGD